MIFDLDHKISDLLQLCSVCACVSEFTHRDAAGALRPTIRSLIELGGDQRRTDAPDSDNRLAWTETAPLPRRGLRGAAGQEGAVQLRRPGGAAQHRRYRFR